MKYKEQMLIFAIIALLAAISTDVPVAHTHKQKGVNHHLKRQSAKNIYLTRTQDDCGCLSHKEKKQQKREKKRVWQ